ncbi:MAG TPA: prolyl oligopeptidase family serine peptidase [Steroidobacteraceae bacterium]|jgi:dipeptidyl aminopeptidase/acylaminoacyl peptidase|nr:prolyl oligopeptidase family serine peptidase [Steroidobacteraceae bacterium]
MNGKLLLTILAATVGLAAHAATEERGNLVLDNIPSVETPLTTRLEDYLNSRGASFVDWMPDGSLLISTRFADVEQLHLVAAPQGAREQLTFSREPVSVARAPQTAVAPGFVFLRDQGGNENSQVYYFDSTSRAVRMLTSGQGVNGGLVWSHDGKRVAYHSTARDGISYDLFIAEPANNSSQPRLVFNGFEKNWSVQDWSPDDTKLLIRNFVSATESHLFVMDIATAALTPVSEGSATASVSAARFTPDGRSVYLVTDRDSEFEQLRRVDLVTGAVDVLTGHIPWDIDDFARSDDGRYLAWVANADGMSRLTVLDLAHKSEMLPPLPDGRIGRIAFDRSGKRLALSLESPQSPRDVFVLELERNAVVRYTKSEAGPIDPLQFVPAGLVRYPTFDRADGGHRQVPAFVYRPKTPGPHPVLIDIHGGPEAQAVPVWSPFTQFLVREMGFVVITPNVRGSSGYGRSYLDLDNGEDREDAVKDIGALLVWIGTQRDLDAKNVFVSGGSYGGYLSLASMVNFSDRLRGGIDVVGISSFVTFLESTSAYRRNLRRPEYGDERLPKMRAYLQRISPLTNAVRIGKPLLVVQGLNDPRVPASESQQLVAKVRARGGEVWYLAAKDEGHGFRKKANRDFQQKAMVTFLEKQLAAK